ncbi:ANKRD63, partial [Symbiodinium necroappetens]
VQILADDGASLDLKDDEGWDVLMWAALSGHFEICELLVGTFHMSPDYATEKGETALMKAAANGHWDVCEFLITEGAK